MRLTVLIRHIPFATLLVLFGAIACADMELPTGQPETSVNRSGDSIDSSHTDSMLAANLDLDTLVGADHAMGRGGCFRVRGRSLPGDVLFHVPEGGLAQYRCPGKSHDEVVAIVAQYKESLASNAGLMAASMSGYWLLTVVSTQLCTLVTEFTIINGEMRWSRSYWELGSCQWVDEIRVEWLGSDEIPDPWTTCCDAGNVPPPDTTTPPPPAPDDSLSWLGMPNEDFWVAGDTIPCPTSSYESGPIEWCSPSSTTLNNMKLGYRQRFFDAVSRMRAIGGICATLADMADSVYSRQGIKANSAASIGGWAEPNGGVSGSVFLHANWLDAWYDSAHKVSFRGRFVTLQFMIAHEMDHVLGEIGHQDSQAIETTHSDQCSDVSTL